MKKNIITKNLTLVIALLVILVSGVYVFSQSTQQAKIENKNLTAIDTTIASLANKIDTNPTLARNYFVLSNAYLQKVRETGDASYYLKIESLLDEVEKIEPENAEIFSLRSSIAIRRHNFKDGEKFALSAIAKNPNKADYFGLLGDAEIELGNYDSAVEAYQKMVNIRPDFSSYSRISYARELYGDIPGALEALRLAISSGSGYEENIAWAHVEAGKLAMRSDLLEAKKFFNQALFVMPDYSPAYQGLGRVAYAEGNTDEALKQLGKAFDILPLAQYSTDLADVYQELGDTEKSKQYFTLAEIAYKKSTDSGVNIDLEESAFLLDHDVDVERALEIAKRVYEERSTIYTTDNLAWAYYKNGEYKEASRYAKEALRLGEFDSSILFHQGLIALKNNEIVTGEKYIKLAESLNPHFSINQSKVLKETLLGIGNGN